MSHSASRMHTGELPGFNFQPRFKREAESARNQAAVEEAKRRGVFQVLGARSAEQVEIRDSEYTQQMKRSGKRGAKLGVAARRQA